MDITLNSVDFAAISPILIIVGGALLLLLVETFFEKSSKGIAYLLTLAIFAGAAIAAYYAPVSNNALLTPWITFDPLARIFTIFFLLIGLGTTLLAEAFFQRVEATRGEYYFLLLSSVFGLILIGISADFLTLFIGLETLSIALYVLCGYMKRWEFSHEAAIKYFLMGSLAAAFTLYGIALIYGALGTTRFDALLSGYHGLSTNSDTALFLTGIALVTLGFAFKATIVPFHVWAPDVYDGAPTPVTAFMAVGTKVGAFTALTRVFLVALPGFSELWSEGIAFLIYPTLIYANIVALRQTQLRRFFAYSGISHAGFSLIPFAAQTPESLSALLFYLIVYALATLGAFGVIAFLDDRREGVMLRDLNGLFRRSPMLAGILSVCMLTLAGIPPTAGFFAKFFIFKVAFEAGYYALVIVALLTTILSAFYYLRIVTHMFSEVPIEPKAPSFSRPAAGIALIAFAAIVFLSFYPEPVMTILTK